MMRLTLAALMCAASAGAAAAQTPERAGEFERAFGGGAGTGGFEQPIEAGTRDANGNRLIVDGRIMIGESTLFGGLIDSGAGGVGAASAIGNQLNVITQGSWNTVIVDANQTNTGDLSAVANGGQ